MDCSKCRNEVVVGAQPSAYCRLGELKVVPVTSYDRRFDEWIIDVPLSEGCGSPELGEEIML